MSHFAPLCVRMLAIERLESRKMLVWAWSFDAGVLSFFGTIGDDHIIWIRGAPPSAGGGPNVVWFNQDAPGGALVPVETAVPAGAVKEITINGDSGDDQIFLQDGFDGIDPLEILTVQGSFGDDWIISVPPGEVRHPTHPASKNPNHNIFLDGYYGMDTIDGGDDPEAIRGSFDPDYLWGGGGNDYVDGGAGDDLEVSGEGGRDRVIGGPGDDPVLGGDDQDVLEGGPGNDTINGGDGADVLYSNTTGSGIDQPWEGLPPQFVGWFDMDGSGPDNDGDCDIEDGHADLDGVTPCPGALVAVDDSYSVPHRQILSVVASGVLLNDTRTQSTTVEVMHQPQYGILTGPAADGSFQYDPQDTFVGTDDFYYRLVDGSITSNLARVVINVTNTPPTVNNDISNTGWQTPVTINVLNNDGDPDCNPSGTCDDIDIHAITQQPTKGTLSVNYETGAITYTYTGPNPGMTPTNDAFRYRARDDWNASNGEATVLIYISGTPLMLDQPPVEPSSDTREVTQAELAALAEEAARRWVLAGVDPVTARKALEGTQIVVQDLPGSMLGAEFPGMIVIDVNAAGYGWFVDASSSTDDEYSILVAPSERQAARGGDPYGHVDALTVLMHEFGHSLGMEHDEMPHSVMNETLSLSTRRIPTQLDILAADDYYARLWASGSTVKRRKW